MLNFKYHTVVLDFINFDKLIEVMVINSMNHIPFYISRKYIYGLWPTDDSSSRFINNIDSYFDLYILMLDMLDKMIYDKRSEHMYQILK